MVLLQLQTTRCRRMFVRAFREPPAKEEAKKRATFAKCSIGKLFAGLESGAGECLERVLAQGFRCRTASASLGRNEWLGEAAGLKRCFPDLRAQASACHGVSSVTDHGRWTTLCQGVHGWARWRGRLDRGRLHPWRQPHGRRVQHPWPSSDPAQGFLLPGAMHIT